MTLMRCGGLATIFALLVTAAVLLAPAVTLASARGGEAEPLDIAQTLWSMGIKIVNFALLAFILVKFLSKPLADYLSARAEAIRKNLGDLETEKSSREKAVEVCEQRLKGIDEEIGRIKAEAHLEMGKEKEQALAEAHRTAQEIIHHTQDTIKQEFAKAKTDLHAEAVALSLELAEGLIKKNLNDRDHRRLAEEYILKIAKEQ